MYNRILIIGCSGSGKSTLAGQLGARLQADVIHLDQLWWREGWVHVTEAEFDRQLQEVLQKPRFVMDGNFDRTLPLRLQYCDAIIFLDLPRWTCLSSVIRRVARGRGRVRPDMSAGCPERLYLAFLLWIWSSHKKIRLKNYELLAQCTQPVFIVKNRKEIPKMINQICKGAA